MALAALFGLTQAGGCIIVTDDDKGQFRFTWSANATCESVGANAISVLVTRSGTSSGIDELFPCSGNMGTVLTPMYRAGTYTVDISAIDDNDTPDNPSDDYVFDQHGPFMRTITYDAEIVDLPHADFDFLGTFAFAIMFKVDFGTSAGTPNCTAAPGGNGIHSQEIFLNPRGTTFDMNACYEYTLWGVDQENMEFESDTCGTNELCMENTVTQYILDVIPGGYTLWIWGLKDNSGTLYDCFGGYVDVDVIDQDVDLTTVLVPPLSPQPSQCNQ